MTKMTLIPYQRSAEAYKMHSDCVVSPVKMGIASDSGLYVSLGLIADGVLHLVITGSGKIDENGEWVVVTGNNPPSSIWRTLLRRYGVMETYWHEQDQGEEDEL